MSCGGAASGLSVLQRFPYGEFRRARLRSAAPFRPSTPRRFTTRWSGCPKAFRGSRSNWAAVPCCRAVMTSSSRSPPAPAGRHGPRWTLLPDRIPDDRVVMLDRTSGVLHFPPAVREPDGSLRSYGAVPPAGSPIRVPSYSTGGGPRGNVAARALSVLRSSIPFVNSVENRRAAHGGVAGETIEQAKERGPLALRTRDRAITAEDYEQLAKRAAPDIARVRCIPASYPRGCRWRENPGGSGRGSGQGQPADVP